MIVIQLLTTRGTIDGICEAKESRKHDIIWEKNDRNDEKGKAAVKTYEKQN